MTHILRLLFEFQTPYKGDIRFLTGNALRHALSPWEGDLDCSVGKFTESPSLIVPKTYYEFFKIRMQKYLPPFNFERFFDKFHNRVEVRHFTTPRFVTFDMVNPPDDFIAVLQAKKLLQLGGGRNCGFGVVQLKEFVWIDFGDISLPEIATHLTLIAPMMFLPGIVEKYDCRREQLRVWNHGSMNRLLVFSAGQFFRLKKGIDISKIAREGMLRRIRKGHRRVLHQFGFGEFILNDFTPGGQKNG